MRPVTILVLSKYRDLFDAFKANVDEYAPHVPRILVRTGHDIPHPGPDWAVYQGEDPFIFSRNVNIGWRESYPTDLILAGDDVRFRSHGFVYEMQALAYSDPKIAFVVPELGGQSAFVCAYIKRDIIAHVGYMDEQFDSYSYQDNDYYHRYELAGYHTQVLRNMKAEHTGGTSFYRTEREGGERVQDSADRGRVIYNKKWGTDL